MYICMCVFWVVTSGRWVPTYTLGVFATVKSKWIEKMFHAVLVDSEETYVSCTFSSCSVLFGDDNHHEYRCRKTCIFLKCFIICQPCFMFNLY
jgi:hypothetical protein